MTQCRRTGAPGNVCAPGVGWSRGGRRSGVLQLLVATSLSMAALGGCGPEQQRRSAEQRGVTRRRRSRHRRPGRWGWLRRRHRRRWRRGRNRRHDRDRWRWRQRGHWQRRRRQRGGRRLGRVQRRHGARHGQLASGRAHRSACAARSCARHDGADPRHGTPPPDTGPGMNLSMGLITRLKLDEGMGTSAADSAASRQQRHPQRRGDVDHPGRARHQIRERRPPCTSTARTTSSRSARAPCAGTTRRRAWPSGCATPPIRTAHACACRSPRGLLARTG